MTARDWTAVREALVAVDAREIYEALLRGDRAAVDAVNGRAGHLMNAIHDVLIVDALPAFEEARWQFIDENAESADSDRTPAAREVA